MFGFFSKRPANVTRVAAPAGAVQRSTQTLMQQRGWQRTKDGWAGPYATRHGTWPGTIHKAGDTLRVYIRNPPDALRRHHKWHCFHKHDDSGWFSMHLSINPVDGDPNAVIRYCEQIITESFKLA